MRPGNFKILARDYPPGFEVTLEWNGKAFPFEAYYIGNAKTDLPGRYLGCFKLLREAEAMCRDLGWNVIARTIELELP